MTRVLAAPGNAGIAASAECFPSVAADDVDTLVNLVDQQDVDLTVVGPEVPLVAGLADELRKRGRNVFGPSAPAARIEGSKAFAKDVMERRGVPTARAGVFDDPEKATAFVDELGGMAVVKADGLAAGKGVTVATDRETAVAAIEESLVGGAFGEAGRTLVVEELLEGPEVSVFAVTDGKGNCVLLDAAQDAKRIGDGDTGPEHRRHGRVLAGPCAVARGGDRDPRQGARAGRRRAASLSRSALRRDDAHRRWPEGARVQLPVRRPRDPGAVAADALPRGNLVACLRHRASRLRSRPRRVRRGCRGDGGARERGVSGQLPDRAADQRRRRGRGDRRASPCSTRARPATPRAGS